MNTLRAALVAFAAGLSGLHAVLAIRRTSTESGAATSSLADFSDVVVSGDGHVETQAHMMGEIDAVEVDAVGNLNQSIYSELTLRDAALKEHARSNSINSTKQHVSRSHDVDSKQLLHNHSLHKHQTHGEGKSEQSQTTIMQSRLIERVKEREHGKESEHETEKVKSLMNETRRKDIKRVLHSPRYVMLTVVGIVLLGSFIFVYFKGRTVQKPPPKRSSQSTSSMHDHDYWATQSDTTASLNELAMSGYLWALPPQADLAVPQQEDEKVWCERYFDLRYTASGMTLTYLAEVTHAKPTTLSLQRLEMGQLVSKLPPQQVRKCEFNRPNLPEKLDVFMLKCVRVDAETQEGQYYVLGTDSEKECQAWLSKLAVI